MITPMANLDHHSVRAIVSTAKLMQLQNPRAVVRDEPAMLLWIGAWCTQFSWYHEAPEPETMQ